MTEINAEPGTKPEQPEERSFFGIIVHSFFVIPFLIAVFCILLFVSVRLLTLEQHTASDYLEDIKTGGVTKRWQAAFELSKLLAERENIPAGGHFEQEMISAFKQSAHDDNRVRQYLALAMARTGNPRFVDPIVEALNTEKEENLYALIYALGVLREPRTAPGLYAYLDHPNARIRLAAVMALGSIGDPQAVDPLKPALNDPEPNVRWDAAIAIARMKDLSGKDTLLRLLDRDYLGGFPEVDAQEQTHILLVAIDAASALNDAQLNDKIKQLAENDQNMKVRQAAFAVLK